MNPELIFVIPLVVGIAWVVREAVLYNQRMIAMIGRGEFKSVNRGEFKLVNRDGLLYVVPIPQSEVRRDCDDGDRHRV